MWGWAGTPFQFLLTRLSQGVTASGIRDIESIPISTHTPLARRDPQGDWYMTVYPVFLLTRLSQGVTDGVGEYGIPQIISTHTPLARRDF